MSAARCASLIAVCLLAAGMPATQPKIVPVYGAESPQAVMSALQSAIAADDFNAMLPLISPQGRQDLADDAITALILALNFLDPDNPMPGSTPIPPSAIESRRKAYAETLDVARETLRPFGLGGLVGKPPLSPVTKDTLDAVLTHTDTVVLMRSLYATLQQISRLMGIEKTDEKKIPWSFGTVSDYQITGDTATAKSGTDTLEFERIDGRWYLKAPTP
jgi:hypothetical protein